MRQEFSKRTKLLAFERCGGRCDECGVNLRAGNGPEYDHIVPAALGGSNDLDNCAALCRNCHGAKTAKRDVPMISKGNRMKERAAGIKRQKGRPMPGTKRSGIKKCMNGAVERRVK